MSKIHKIIIACWAGDVRLARICVASIRYWYPEIPIYLLKDESSLKFSTRDLEKYWNVRIYENKTVFNKGYWNYLAPFVSKERKHRILQLDSDTIMMGNLLETLEESDADLLVQASKQNPEWFKTDYYLKHFYIPEEVAKFDNELAHPTYAFNSGQIVFNEGVFDSKDFEPLLNITPDKITKKYPEAFRSNDQSMLNYVTHKKEQNGKIKVDLVHFMFWPGNEHRKIDIDEVRKRQINRPYLIHWAGITGFKYLNEMTYAHLLRFFEEYYYSRIPLRRLVQFREMFRLHLINVYKGRRALFSFLLKRIRGAKKEA